MKINNQKNLEENSKDICNNSKNVLITGASCGIGKALAYEYASHKYNVFLVARNLDKLNEIKVDLEEKYNIKVYVIAKDLVQEKSANELYEEIKNKYNDLDIDILINNAGTGNYGLLDEMNLETECKVIDLNVKALFKLTYLFLKDMKKRKKGKIINIASTASFYPGPLMANYYATKAYVLSLSEALNREVKNTNVNVIAFCPGLTKTDFLKNSNITINRFASTFATKPTQIAKKVYKCSIKKNCSTKIYGFLNNIFILFLKFMPRKFAIFISYLMQNSRR